MKNLTSLHFLQKEWLVLVCMAAMILLAFPGAVQALPAGLIPSPPQVAAESYVLVDAMTGTVLAEKNSNQQLPPASLTKMMTAYVVQSEITKNRIKPDSLVTVSEKAWRMKGSLMFIEVGEKVSVSDLLKGVIIVSGNDASVALAEYVAGSESGFSQMMNRVAVNLDMSNTHFMNASGWPAEDHYSSAQDLAKLARVIATEESEYYHLYAQKEFQYGVDKRTGKPLSPQANRNTLLFMNTNVDGIKTGHSDEAGYCLVASSKREGRRLIAVVMGARSERSRANETQKLLTYGFRFFDNVDIKKKNVTLEKVRIWKGVQNELSVGLEQDLFVTVARGKEKDVQATMLIDNNITAPVAHFQEVGGVKVRLGEQVIAVAPLVALESIEEGGFFKRLWDSIVHFFVGLLGAEATQAIIDS